MCLCACMICCFSDGTRSVCMHLVTCCTFTCTLYLHLYLHFICTLLPLYLHFTCTLLALYLQLTCTLFAHFTCCTFTLHKWACAVYRRAGMKWVQMGIQWVYNGYVQMGMSRWVSNGYVQCRRAGMKCQSVGGQAWNVRAMSAAAYDRISVT